jgi:5-methylcytosine-specific restriction endonuclease McrA
VHRNSMTFDHEVARRDGGGGDMQNLKIAHPYCNSSKG